MEPRKNKRPAGRRNRRDPQALERILKVLRTGLPLRFAASAGAMSPETLYAWRDADPEVEKKIEEARLESVKHRWNLILKAGEDKLDQDGALVRAGDWKSLAWSLERTFPEFARQEVQCQINNISNSVTNNSLVISMEMGDQINRRSKEVESKVERLFEVRRQLKSGNGALPKESEPAVQPPTPADATITRQAGDENRAGFWAQFVHGSGERLVKKATAIFVCRAVVDGVIGYGNGQRVELNFDEDIRICDLIAAIEKLTGGGEGWRWLHKKSQIE